MLVRKNSRLFLWSLRIRGTMVQLGFRPRLRTACRRTEVGRLPLISSLLLPTGAAHPWPSAHLQQGVGRDLHHHSVLGDMAQSFLEQHRAHQVVDIVLGGEGTGQATLPLSLRNGCAEPAGRARPWGLDHLRTEAESAPKLQVLGSLGTLCTPWAPTFLRACSSAGAMASMK